jgi:two-component system nitrogen regulation response regulator GlnG
MEDLEDTQTSPFTALQSNAVRLLGLTILWHPDQRRIGAQTIGPAGAGAVELGRYAPAFHCLDASQAVLGELRIARAPLLITRDARDDVTLTPPESRMTVVVDGVALGGSLRLTADAIARGVVLELGGSVLVCLHWMRGLPQAGGHGELLGVSDGAIMLRELVRQVAGTDVPVLLLGETGTGKEVVARAIHAASIRRHGPLVGVNMAALNESLAAADLFGAEKGAYTGAQSARQGFFGEADGGTLFLDEIGDTPAAIQPMLLRVLETGEYRPLGARANLSSRARLIAATDQDLAAGTFNQALLRRLEGFVIHLPPLRERRQDIGVLIAAQLARAQDAGGTALELPLALVSAMCRYDWPGNIRQLINAVRRVALGVSSGVPVQFEELVGAPAQPQPNPPAPLPAAARAAEGKPRRSLSEVSDEDVVDAMEAGRWQVQAAAERLGISRPSLYKLLAAHPAIRRPEQIPADEIRQALRIHGADLAKCASVLRTPGEALRRHLRVSGLIERDPLIR